MRSADWRESRLLPAVKPMGQSDTVNKHLQSPESQRPGLFCLLSDVALECASGSGGRSDLAQQPLQTVLQCVARDRFNRCLARKRGVGRDESDCSLDHRSRDLRVIFGDAFEDRSQKSGLCPGSTCDDVLPMVTEATGCIPFGLGLSAALARSS
jgi:hypothetical protein